MLQYPGHLLTPTEVSLREHDVRPMLKKAASIFQNASLIGLHTLRGGGDPSLSDVLIDALDRSELSDEEQRAMLHVLQEARDCIFELRVRKDAFGED
jgi:hypothetical protein